MNGFLRHSTLLGSRENGTMAASGFLQKSAVRNWLGGIVPAWTMLDQKSFEALLLPPLPPVGALRFGLLEYRQEEVAGRRFDASQFYRKAPLFDRFLSFWVHLEPTDGSRH
jgi:hypothetical protein